MKRERELELLARLADPAAPRPGPLGPYSLRNPASAYASAERFARERDALFQRRPNLLGLSSECARPGDYLTGSLGGVPVVAVRQLDGSLRAFVNACRHRASRLLDGCGRLERAIACPYHGWLYELDGRLRARPGAEPGFDDIARERLSLHPVAVREAHGLVFARAAGGAFEVDAALEGAQEELAAYGLEHYVHIETRAQEFAFNWKLVIDTFTEPYHIPWLHKATIAPHYYFDRWLFDAYGVHGRFIGVRKSVAEELARPLDTESRLLPHGTTQYLLMPNAVLCHQIDHVELWRVTPLAVDRTRVATSLFAPRAPESDKERAYWVKNLDVLLRVTYAEDFPAMARIHENLASGAVPEVVYGKMEPALVHFHESVNALLAADAA
ncbi:MAG TPA: aromatic ring-hydroxylating dioxygenase subunit alpha [Myxococcota bacterium]|jgi:phenylpropionate dioxygenase-like ring-hydroxylating dioxygenase large terminal subunit